METAPSSPKQQQSRAIELVCPSCPRRDRKHGSLEFDGVISAFVFKCPRGHGWKMRALTRDERRAFRDRNHHAPPPVVATPWEA
jgi:hypothetical protein